MSLLDRIVEREAREGALGRHSLLLCSLVALLVAMPVARLFTTGSTPFSILLMIVMVAAVYVNSTERWTLVLAGLVGAAAVLALGTAEALPGASVSSDLRVLSTGLGLALFALTTMLTFVSLLRSEEVSSDTVVGGICVYLLIGICFALAFTLVGTLTPESFVENGEAILRSESDPSGYTVRMLYFSFVTLTTLGYGDITPEHEIAEILAVAEGVIGQLYLAVFVARLVALYVATNQLEHDRSSLPARPDREDRR